jgi:sulfonate transport system permease protein
VFRLSKLALIRRILLPSILPATIISLRSGLGLGWMFVVAAEFMGASEGLGYLLVDGQQLGRTDQILASLVTFATLGKATDAVLVAVSHPFLRWQDTATSELVRAAGRPQES